MDQIIGNFVEAYRNAQSSSGAKISAVSSYLDVHRAIQRRLSKQALIWRPPEITKLTLNSPKMLALQSINFEKKVIFTRFKLFVEFRFFTENFTHDSNYTVFRA